MEKSCSAPRAVCVAVVLFAAVAPAAAQPGESDETATNAEIGEAPAAPDTGAVAAPDTGAVAAPDTRAAAAPDTGAAAAPDTGAATAPDTGGVAASDTGGAAASDTGGAAVPGAAPPSERGFNLKLRSIEERVNALKEKIFQSKARLIQLQEVVLHGAISGAKAVLVHQNEMGSSFRLRRVQYALDGAPIFNRVDTGNGDLNEQAELEIFNGSIAPGNHQISVYLEYQGYGYGIFSYLAGYTFKIKSSYTFDAEEGKLTTVRIVGYEKGGLTTDLKDRPSVRYDVESSRALRKDGSAEEEGGSTDTE